VYDNLKTGRTANLAKSGSIPLSFIEADVCERNKVEETVPGHEVIFHFCDDSDIRSAAEHPDTFVEQNIMGLFYVLESMRRNGIRLILFPAAPPCSGAGPSAASELHGPMTPLNIYGGAKLAAEGLISAWAHTYDFRAIVFASSASSAAHGSRGGSRFREKTAKGSDATGDTRRRHSKPLLCAGG